MANLIKRVFKPDEYKTEKMMEAILTMKMSKKKLEKEGAKLEKTAEASKKKVAKAMREGDYQTAKIHAESTVRNKSSARSFYRMAARVDAVAGRLKEALAAKTLGANMEKVVQGMSTALSTLTPENVATNLQQFEELSDTLGVNTEFMDKTLNGATKTGEMDNEVQELLEQTADAIGIKKLEGLDDFAGLPVPLKERQQKIETEENDKELDEV